MPNPTAADFLKRVTEHKLTVLRNDGVYRHIRLGRLDSGIDSFHIHTWPGSLCYTGDMGTYVFSRIDDMFNFFHRDDLTINESYWAEKLDAVDRHDGYMEYSPDKFRSAIDWVLECKEEEYKENENMEKYKELRQMVDDQILPYGDDGEESARSAVDQFECDFEPYMFSDFWETELKGYTYRFVWCLYAIVWGIQMYRNHQK